MLRTWRTLISLSMVRSSHIDKVLDSGFAARVQYLERDDTERTLMVTHTANWSARDCLSNQGILMEVLQDADILSSIDEAKLWMDGFRRLDERHGNKLCKNNSPDKLKRWAKTEHDNLCGAVNYFVNKLCINKGSHSKELGDLKAAYFSHAGEQQTTDAKESEQKPAQNTAENLSQKAVSLEGLDYPEAFSDVDQGEEEVDEQFANAQVISETLTAVNLEHELSEIVEGAAMVIDSSEEEAQALCASKAGGNASSSAGVDSSASALAAPRTKVPGYVRESLTTGVKSLGGLQEKRRRYKGKRIAQACDQARKAMKLKVRMPLAAGTRGKFGGNPREDTERTAIQMELKAYNRDLLEASTAIAENVPALEAMDMLCKAVGLCTEEVSYLVSNLPVQKGLVHAKNVGILMMAREKDNDIFRLQNGHKKTILCLSNRSHGRENVCFAAKIMLLVYVIGVDIEALKECKRRMAELIFEGTTNP